jgi:hypothetical protein
MGRNRTWTRTMRDELYSSLVRLFGPYHTWEVDSYPSKTKRTEYNQFLEEFARKYGVTIGAKCSVGSSTGFAAFVHC